MTMDIKFIKELRMMKKQAQGCIDYLNLQIRYGDHSDEVKQKLNDSKSVFQDQIDSADSMIHDEISL